MERIVEQNLLYDFYGELLTEHQRLIYEKAVYEDLSLKELSEEYGIVEMAPPQPWVGKTIRTLDIRRQYGANIIAQRSGNDLKIPPDIDKPLEADTVLVVLGSYKAMEKLDKLEKH